MPKTQGAYLALPLYSGEERNGARHRSESTPWLKIGVCASVLALVFVVAMQNGGCEHMNAILRSHKEEAATEEQGGFFGWWHNQGRDEPDGALPGPHHIPNGPWAPRHHPRKKHQAVYNPKHAHHHEEPMSDLHPIPKEYWNKHPHAKKRNPGVYNPKHHKHLKEEVYQRHVWPTSKHHNDGPKVHRPHPESNNEIGLYNLVKHPMPVKEEKVEEEAESAEVSSFSNSEDDFTSLGGIDKDSLVYHTMHDNEPETRDVIRPSVATEDVSSSRSSFSDSEDVVDEEEFNHN